MLQPGQIVDRFTVESVLGRGGMAVVYLVRHNSLDSLAALKVLTLTGPVVRERLMQEGRVQAGLRHPNIVSVFDVLAVDGVTGLLIEYVDGLSLDRFLSRGRPPLQQALDIFDGVLSGVALAHRQGMVHRDLKPGNVLLAKVDGRLVPKVTDFGLVKILVDEEAGDGFTRSGAAMGTPQYMAPEQIRDAKSVDKRADIFSLGCMLFELACGRPPFQGADMLDLFNSIDSADYPDPLSLEAELPDAVVTAIHGCLRSEREDRLPDCEAVRRVLAGAPLAESIPPREPVPPAAGPVSSGPAAPEGAVDSGTLAGMLDFGPSDSIPVPEEAPPALPAELPPVPTRPASPRPAPAAPVSTMDASHSLRVDSVVPEPPPAGGPRAWLLGVAGALIVGVGAVLLWPRPPQGSPPPAQAQATPLPAPASASDTLPAGVSSVEAPVRVAPAKAAPVKPVPMKSAPEKAAPSKSVPVESAPAKAAPAKAAPPVAVAGAPPPDEPSPPPERAPAAPGRFEVSSEGAAAYLLSADGVRYLEGTDVPPGHYAVRAMLDGRSYVPAGSVDLHAGQTTRVTCSKTLMTCRAE